MLFLAVSSFWGSLQFVLEFSKDKTYEAATATKGDYATAHIEHQLNACGTRSIRCLCEGNKVSTFCIDGMHYLISIDYLSYPRDMFSNCQHHVLETFNSCLRTAVI